MDITLLTLLPKIEPKYLPLVNKLDKSTFSRESLIALLVIHKQQVELEQQKNELLMNILKRVNSASISVLENHELQIDELNSKIEAQKSKIEAHKYSSPEEIAAALKQQKSESARHSAKKRHETTNKRKKEIQDYWLENIGDKYSNEESARRLAETFKGISHKTLVKYVSEAKKEIQLCKEIVNSTDKLSL